MNNTKDQTGFRINFFDPDASKKIGEYISHLIQEKTLIVCIGTDKCIGDCLGPLVGTILKTNKFSHPILGTVDFPVHAINLTKTIREAEEEYKDYFVIAVDACLGFSECVGDIQVKLGPVHPGKGVGKKLPKVGDISIVGVVDTIDNSDIFSIRNIRLSYIMKMANIIADSIMHGFSLYENNS